LVKTSRNAAQRKMWANRERGLGMGRCREKIDAEEREKYT
jgi:hypothetical protein